MIYVLVHYKINYQFIIFTFHHYAYSIIVRKEPSFQMFLSNPPQVARRLPVMTFHQHHQMIPHPHNAPTFSSFYSPSHMENQFNYQSGHQHNHQQFTNVYNQQHIINNDHNQPQSNTPIHLRMGIPNAMHNINWSEQIPIQTRNNNFGNGNKSNEHG